MLVLFETAPGYALFKVLDEGKLRDVEDIWKEFQTADAARKVVKLKAFHKFENTAEALGAATSLVECKLSKGLRKFLKAECGGETLAIADSKLGRIVSEKLEINCVHNNAVVELMRGVRTQLVELIEGLSQQDLAPMSLGLSHSLCRYTLKFSPDKVDTMIVQAIGLLDELDKELNTYAMRVKEWYGWHFPELGKIIQDNIQYAKAVKLMGKRENAQKIDFSAILAEEVEAEVKEAVQISMGTDISDEDMGTIQIFCEQVISLSEYRAQLFEYLRSRMKAIAPNLTVLVGELVGARLIAHAGSLVNLAKQPSSTIQILGAEKALFRALKTKHNTPKYGLIYHASLVGQAPAKIKGKIARVLAAKSALSTRIDALGESEDAALGTLCREKVEARLRQLEGRALGKLSGVNKGKAKIEVYEKDRKKDTPGLLTAPKTYATDADVTLGKSKKGDSSKRKKDDEDEAPEEAEPPKKKKKHSAEDAMPGGGVAAPSVEATPGSEKKKKKKKQQAEAEEAEEAEPLEEPQQEKKKKKKSEDPEAAPVSEGKKKKKKHVETEATGAEEETPTPSASSKKKKKKSVEAEAETEATPSSKKKKRKANEE